MGLYRWQKSLSFYFEDYLKMAEHATTNNIGETNKTSVKVTHGPGGQSNWSLGWVDPTPLPSKYKGANSTSPPT
jgi:hypothetical protein